MSRGPAQWIRVDGVDEPGSGPTIGVDSSTPRQALAASDPEQIGPYRILGRIGEGGMATVYKAEQRDPVRRIVALKVIKLGMDSKQVVARFEAERQALALMNHPNVAKVFEAGMTDGGRPYFAMEFVPGVPITRFCDDSRLTLRQRIELFIPVCQAVQHAHQKGIIHRDLKPGNILVQLFEGEPVPKVIDFGIAKATNQSLTQHTLHTEVGSMLGTPEYMSPEQAQTSGLDVDTRTDIYSLGVILYQLLTGTLPFDPRELRSGGPEGIVRTLRESEPPRPSTRVGSISTAAKGAVDATSEDPLTRLTRTHAADPHTLLRELKGDLDWIVLKAMHKDRSRRYATANALALDQRRYLDEDPVAARSPTTLYRIQKFTRRHRTGVFLTIGMFMALLVSLAAVTAALVRANHQQHIAEDRTREAVEQKKQADEATRQVGRVSRLVEQMLSDLIAVTGRDLMPQQALDRVAAELDNGSQKPDPATELRVRQTLARRYSLIGCYRRAAAQLDAVVSLVRATWPRDGATLADCLNELAGALIADGQIPAAERSLLEAQALLSVGPTDSPAMATNLELLGVVLADHGQLSSAQQNYERASKIRHSNRQSGADPLSTRLNQADLRLSANPSDSAAARDLEQTVAAMQMRTNVASPQMIVGPLRILARSAARRGDWKTASRLLQIALGTHCNDWGLLHEVLQVQEMLVKTQTASPEQRWQHASLAARTGDFAVSESELVPLLKQDPPNGEAWELHLMLLLRLGDQEAYRQSRSEALGRFAGSHEHELLHRISKGSLVCPLDPRETLLAASMADQAERLKPQVFYHQTEGMAKYRQRNYRDAISWFEKCRGRGVLYLDVAGDFYLAMAWAALGDRDRAMQFWDEGTALWEEQAPRLGVDDLAHPEDWILCELARREARGMLYPTTPATRSVAIVTPGGAAVEQKDQFHVPRPRGISQ